MKANAIHVIGGGFSGLVQAFYLIEKGLSVKVIEKSPQLGGLLGTRYENGFLIERAANAFLANAEIERVSDIIGVKLVPTLDTAKKRYIYRNNNFRRWPLGFSGSLKLLPFLFDRILKRNLNIKLDENLRQWGERNIGREATDFLLEPAMQGIFAAPTEELDARLVLDSIFLRRKRGELKGSIAPEKGMGFWVEKMVEYLTQKGCQFELESTVYPEKNTIYALSIKHLKELHEQNILDLPRSIEQTQTTSLTSAVVMFENRSEFPEGFGCLFPNPENFNALGVLFNNNIFTGRANGGFSETWIFNDRQKACSKLQESELLGLIQEDRTRLGESNRRPASVSVHQWKGRIPLYNKELRQFIKDIENWEKPYLFSGHSFGQLGLSKLIFKAKENAEKVSGGYFG